MQTAVLLAIAASFCTATASLAQRAGAKNVQTTGGFDARLLLRLARQPIWLVGIFSMIGGFVFQLTALRYGPLALVQPSCRSSCCWCSDAWPSPGGGDGGSSSATGWGRSRCRRESPCSCAWRRRPAGTCMQRVPRGFWPDWSRSAWCLLPSPLPSVWGTVAAPPPGGRLHAPGSSWLLAGLVTLGLVLAALAAAFGLGNRRLGNRRGAVPTRRAAVLGSATGIAWGFVAAVIKELSSHLGGGVGSIFSTWSLYVLLVAGAATMLLASHALAAGPLAASQPGFTILDPLSASLLGVFLFGEHIQTGPWNLAGEALALGLVAGGAAVLSRSCFILGELGDPSCLPPKIRALATSRQRTLLGAGGPGSGEPD